MDMVDKATLEGAVEYIGFVLHKDTDTLVLQFADDTSPQIDHLLVVVGNTFLDDARLDMLLVFIAEET